MLDILITMVKNYVIWQKKYIGHSQIMHLIKENIWGKQYLKTRNLGARWAPISSWWPSATLLALRACLTSSFTPCFDACEGRWVKNVTDGQRSRRNSVL